MHPSKKSWSLQLRKALIFLFILTISSCGGCKKKGKGKENSQRAFIMLIHGIADQHDGVSNLSSVINPLKEALEGGQDKNKKRDIEIFAPARKNSVNASIKEQAEDMFKVIQEKGITQNDKLILMAHSQGGPVAMALYAMFMQDWKNMAIVSVQGALRGSHGAQPNPVEFNTLTKDIQQLIAKVKLLIEGDKIVKLNTLLSTYGGFMGGADKMKEKIVVSFPSDTAIKQQIQYALGWQNGQGGKDLVPGSSFMQELKSQMPNPVTIPMFLVAGKVEDFVKCISEVVFDDTKKRILEEVRGEVGALADMVGGVLDQVLEEIVQNADVKSAIEGNIQTNWDKLVSNGDHNDLVVPVDSQLGKGLIQGDKVRMKTYPDYMHLHKLISTPMFDDEVNFIKDFINN